MKINSQSSSTLVWSAAFILIAGVMVISPAGQFISYIIAAALVLVPALFGSKGQRIAGLAVLAASLLLAFQVYPVFRKEGEGYRKRVDERPVKVPAQLPVQQQEFK